MYVLLNTKHFVNGHIQKCPELRTVYLPIFRATKVYVGLVQLATMDGVISILQSLWFLVFSDVLSIPKNYPSPSCPHVLVHLSVLLPWLISPLLTSPTAAATAAAEDEDKQQDEDDQPSTESPHDVVELRIIRTKTKDTHSIRWDGGGGGGGGGRGGGGRGGGRQ